MRRFTRLTNGFSKKVENLAHAVSLHYMHYNFARPHTSLGKHTTPAMAAGVAEYPWVADDIAGSSALLTADGALDGGYIDGSQRKWAQKHGVAVK